MDLLDSFDGSIEAKLEQANMLRVFASYGEIADGYMTLLDNPGTSLEAVKRVVFLAWYNLVEPNAFSGICFDTSRMQETYPVLERDRLSAQPDAELSAMLSWYYVIADYAFPDLDTAPHLKKFLVAVATNRDKAWAPRVSVVNNRGQMGQYWGSLRHS